MTEAFARAEGRDLVVSLRNGKFETHTFDSVLEATQRAAVINEALSWVGTPFINCADVKGPDGGVDCAMLQVRSFVDPGVLPPFDPRPYPPQWMMHQGEQRFIDWVENKLHARRVENCRPADVSIYWYGHCYSHGTIAINSRELVHANARLKLCHIASRDDTELKYFSRYSLERLRPVNHYTAW